MYKIHTHPILDIPEKETVTFTYQGKPVSGEKGFTIAAALHQAGYPVHSHSLKNRNRSLECGIGKCGACEMLVDGQIKRICITKVDGVQEVREIPKGYTPEIYNYQSKLNDSINIFRTTVAIVGAGPAGLAAREELKKHGIRNIVIDSNDKIGGQFLMQTHQFFFFEREKKFGGMRGFDIASTLAGEEHDGIFLHSTVWDILEGKLLAVKNTHTDEIFYVHAKHLIVATGAIPFMPNFKNDDLPGVYTAAVVQKMMNTEFTLLGKNVLTVGAGNIGYLTSYQLMQAGAKVRAIIEAQEHEGGFPVQANRVRRLGIPILTSHLLLEAIPNPNNDGIVGAVVAESKNFEPIPGTEQVIGGIDAINICTGLVPDDALLIKGKEIFARNCHAAGDAIRIGEGTSAVLRGKQVAFEILDEMNKKFDYDQYLKTSKEYIDSQQHPIEVLEEPEMPSPQRRKEKPFVLVDCLHGFACNPCAFACPYEAITKSSTSTVPRIDYEKCTGCMKCISQCPGLAIFGYNLKKNQLFLPVEYEVKQGTEVFLVNNNGEKLGEGVIQKVMKKPNKTDVVRVESFSLQGDNLLDVRGFISKEQFPETLHLDPNDEEVEAVSYICHCEDIRLEEIMQVIGKRKFISVDEIKHTTRLGMGACRGKRCIARLKQTLRGYGVQVVGEPTPRGPLSNQLEMGELYPHSVRERIFTNIKGKKNKVLYAPFLIAGGGIGGSALFRYLAQAGERPLLINYGHGSSWRNIAGGRPAFSIPELSEIARANRQIFEDLQEIQNIDYKPIKYINFAHDQASYKALEASMSWQKARMLSTNDFQEHISPYFNPKLTKYKAALLTEDCWQATPGKVVDLIRKIGQQKGGTILEDSKIIDVRKDGEGFRVLIEDHQKNYLEYKTDVFINALGEQADQFAQKIGIQTNLFSVKHQAFITRRLPMLGAGGDALSMLIDRRKYKGFSAVYGQQLAETGQIIGCASPTNEPAQTDKNLTINSKDFLEIVAETFIDWIPELSSAGFQAVWAGYYVEPRMIIDPEKGLFIGLRGQGFMLGQYLAKLFVDKLTGKHTPEYFDRLKTDGDGLLEKAFK